MEAGFVDHFMDVKDLVRMLEEELRGAAAEEAGYVPGAYLTDFLFHCSH